MFVGLREMKSAKGRFGLIVGTVTLITLLVVVLTGLRRLGQAEHLST